MSFTNKIYDNYKENPVLSSLSLQPQNIKFPVTAALVFLGIAFLSFAAEAVGCRTTRSTGAKL